MCRAIRPGGLTAAVLLLAAGCAGTGSDETSAGATEQTTTRIDVASLGPQVGELVPDFSLRDQSGRTWTRESIMGPRGAMLVFFRSAGW